MNYSLRQVVNANREDTANEIWNGSWSFVILYRWPGYFAATLFLRMGLHPTQVTMGSLALALMMPLLALVLPISIAASAVCIAAVLFQVFDCADGAMARAADMRSERGGRLDFLIDMLQWGLLYVSIGILADQQFNSPWIWALLGMTAGWLRLFARLCNDSMPSTPPEPGARPPLVYQVISGISGLFPFLALSGTYLHIAVLGLLIYSLLDLFDVSMRVAK